MRKVVGAENYGALETINSSYFHDYFLILTANELALVFP